MLNSATISESCCDKRINKAIAAGKLDTAERWECPKCGCEWLPTIINGAVRLWAPHVYYDILEPR